MGILPDWMIERDIGITPLEQAGKREGKISYGLSSYGLDCRLGYKFKVFKPYPATVIDPKNFDPRMLEDVDLTQDTAHKPKSHKDGTYSCSSCGKVIHVGGDIIDPPCPVGKPDHLIIPPHSFVLAESLEHFKIPRDVLCVVLGKSTYARCGLIVNVTPGEPEWEGHWTIELSNTTPLPMKVYPGEGIMQCLFFRSDGWRESLFNKIKSLGDTLGLKSVTQAVADMVTSIYHWRSSLDFLSCRTSYKDKVGKYQSQAGLTLPTVDGKDN